MSSPPLVQTEPFRRHLTGLVGQLQKADPAELGGVARRASNYGIWLVEALWHERSQFVTAPEQVALLDAEEARLVMTWVEWVYDRNQFFDLNPRVMGTLCLIHRRLRTALVWQLGNAESFDAFAAGCQLSFVLYAERLNRLFRHLATSDKLRGCAAEYSPELQLKLLGLAEQTAWKEPIVDLGCGIDAHLVHHLRTRGLQATGVERRGGGPSVLARDWFELRFEPQSLGTIISHLAFSLQFLHQHWQGSERAYDFARKYMELLHSLVQGGVFCYAPGLPFIEAMLDRAYFDVITLPLPEPLAASIGSLRDLSTGQSVAYACQVRRR